MNSKFAKWCKEKFGGSGSNIDARRYADRIVTDKLSITEPPIRLTKVAEFLGMNNPKPVYKINRTLKKDGELYYENGELRIILNFRKDRSQLKRMRFTYAHELGHLLFFDLSKSPPLRVAPNDDLRKEEQICNGLATGFLMPSSLLAVSLTSFKNYDYNSFKATADLYDVSLQSLLIGIESLMAKIMHEDEFIMVSFISRNRYELGKEKPRCFVTFVNRKAKKSGKSFLAAYEGIDKIVNLSPQGKSEWSLFKFINANDPDSLELFVSNEYIILPDKREIRLYNVKHKKVTKTYYWTTGKFAIEK